MFPINSKDLWYNRPNLLDIDFTSFLHSLLPTITHKEDKQKLFYLWKKSDDMLLIYAISLRQLWVHLIPMKQEAGGIQHKASLLGGNH